MKLFDWWPIGRQSAPARPARTPDGTRIYAVGDIHGRADLLGEMQRKIEQDASYHADKHRVLIYLGDYVDRGPQSREVLERLSNHALDGIETHFLIGNHEQAMLGFLDKPLKFVDWLNFGGLATLASYGVPHGGQDADSLMLTAAALKAAIPAHQMAFLRQLERLYQVGDYLFVHAGIAPEVPIASQRTHDLLWIRGQFLNYTKPHPAMVVHGHHVTDNIDLRPNRIGIDTGAYATGCLSCLILDGTDRELLDSRSASAVPVPI